MDCVTQWQVVASVQTISEVHLLPVIEHMLAQFPFEILGFQIPLGFPFAFLALLAVQINGNLTES